MTSMNLRSNYLHVEMNEKQEKRRKSGGRQFFTHNNSAQLNSRTSIVRKNLCALISQRSKGRKAAKTNIRTPHSSSVVTCILDFGLIKTKIQRWNDTGGPANASKFVRTFRYDHHWCEEENEKHKGEQGSGIEWQKINRRKQK